MPSPSEGTRKAKAYESAHSRAQRASFRAAAAATTAATSAQESEANSRSGSCAFRMLVLAYRNRGSENTATSQP
eukprot:13901951-Alexandrium_andersonii.AAC.1